MKLKKLDNIQDKATRIKVNKKFYNGDKGCGLSTYCRSANL